MTTKEFADSMAVSIGVIPSMALSCSYYTEEIPWIKSTKMR